MVEQILNSLKLDGAYSQLSAASFIAGLALSIIFLLISFIPDSIPFWKIKRLNIPSPNKKTLLQIIGSLFILSVSFAANNVLGYIVSIFVIATLVTELQFLEKFMAIIWNRKEYWKHLDKENRQDQQQESPVPNSANPDDPMRSFSSLDELESVPDSPAARARDKYLVLFVIEVVYRLIFHSQVETLRQLRNASNEAQDRSVLEAYHRRTKWANTYPFDDYIGFLTKFSLMERPVGTNNYKLSWLGKIFLEYIDKYQLPQKEPDLISQ